MASTYTPNGIELIADGEQSNTWGQTTNTNWELMEEMVAGVVSISITGLSTYTLTTADGITSNGRHAVIKFTGSPSGTVTVTVSPNDAQKVYFIDNASNQDLTLTQGSGANVTAPAGFKKIVYCDGAGSGAAVTDMTDNLSLSGTVDVSTIKLDGTEVTATAAELNTLDGITSTVNELNILDGVTATTAELNKLDGFTGSATDLNYAKDLRATGVTTAEFDKLDGLTATTAELNKLDGFTGSATDLNYAKDLRATGVTTAEFDKLDGLTATTAELNKLDGFTGSATDLNYAKDLRATGVTTAEFDRLDGVTSSIQPQLDSKASKASNLSDLTSASTARTNLGLGSVATESTVPVSKGGTGRSTLTNGRLLVGNNTGAVDLLAGSSPGQVLSWNGVAWTTASLPSSGVANVTASAPLSSSGGATPNISLTTPVAVTYGGTGAASASGARTNLGLASIEDNGTYISMTRPFQTTGYGWTKDGLYVGTYANDSPGAPINPNALGFHVNSIMQLNIQTNGIAPAGFSRYDRTGAVISFGARGSQVGTITITTTSTSYNTTSDERLKKNIKDAEESGSKIDALRVRQFDWRETDEHQRYGVVAQEVESVYPEIVSKPEDNDSYYTVDYSKLVPLLLKEIQALRARVAALEAA